MYLSLNWLKKYIDLPKDLSVDKLVYDLTMSSMEVEDVVDQAKQFEKMVVGKVVELKKHPNADNLKLAYVDVGSAVRKHKNTKIPAYRQGRQKHTAGDMGNGLIQVVCGGTNLREGMVVPVALPGAKVRWHGKGDLMELEEAKIRGEKSFGMICASNEIGIQGVAPCGEMEITDLSGFKGIRVGQSLGEALGMDNVIIEVENKTITNRPDLWNHYGVARELSAIYNLELKPLDLYKLEDIKKLEIRNKKLGKLQIEIKNEKLCQRYMGCVVENIKVEESPGWLKKAVLSAGMRPINNIVDITNYVMMDVGEPMHAFDMKTLKHENTHLPKPGTGGQVKAKIVVRKAEKGEKIVTLDGEERELDESMLIIANDKGPVAIAGVMGGAGTEVEEKTTSIVLEAASFDDMSVRRTTQKLGLRTEASNRFEKNLDANFVELAMMRVLKLIKDIMPDAEIKELMDEDYSRKKETKIEVEHDFLEKRIGHKFSSREVIGILERLGFGVESIKQENNKTIKQNNNEIIYLIIVPSWRATGDVSIPEDIVEEVARIYGYDNLEDQDEKVDFEKAKYQPEFDLQNRLKNYLSVGCGMSEVFNYPWAEKRILKGLGLLDDEMVEIDNPPADENKYLQTSLVPNLIKNVEDNLRFFDEFKLFELSRVFKPEMAKFDNGDDKLPVQPKMLAGVVVLDKGGDVFHEIKGMIGGLQTLLNCCIVKLLNKNKFIDENKAMSIKIGDEDIGWFGEVSSNIYKNFDLKNKKVGLFEINFTELIRAVETQNFTSLHTRYTPLPQYPEIERDIALELEMQVEWDLIKKIVQGFNKLIRRVEFLSVFNLEDQNKKSLAFRVIYRSDEKTLTSEEVEEVENKLLQKLEKETGGSLRN